MTSRAQTSAPLVSELAGTDMAELIEMFVAELPDKIAAIETAAGERDFAGLGTLAHQLKGAAGGYGFPSITDSAKDVEHGAKSPDNLESLHSQVRALTDLCRRATADASTG